MKTLLVVVAVAVVSFFFGCSSLSVNSADEQVVPVEKTILHFSVDFGSSVSESLAKVAVIGDGLNVSERQAIFAYRKSKVKFINLDFYKDGSVSERTHTFHFPVVDGKVSGEMSVLPGTYSMIEVLTDREPGTYLPDYDFQQIIKNFNVKSGEDTLKMQLKQKESVKSTVVISVPDGIYEEGKSYKFFFEANQPWNFSGWSSDPIFQGGKIIWSGVDVYLKKDEGNFRIGDKILSGEFDVTKILDNDTIEMSTTAAGPLVLNVGFLDDAKPEIDSVFPKEDAVNVPTNILSVKAFFDKPLADWSDMPGAQFGVASEDGSDQVSGTCSFTGTNFFRNLDNGTSRVYLKPNTKYIAHISAVKDDLGNEMVGEKRWSFTTGN
jgi:hypothetical protein